jgi:NAD(P)-dependent dehydrogenase (short-subunit alcohol dehydrogenase family)
VTGRDRVAVVTGGGAGIGAETVRLLAAEGAAVAVLDLNPEAAATVAKSVVEDGGDALAVEVDVADEGSVTAGVARVIDTWGRVDVLANNAGLAQPTEPLVSTDVAVFDRVVAVNLRGTFLMTKHVAPHMADGGAIVNIASVAALMGVAGIAAYSAAKGGVAALTRATAAELAPRIRVNCVCPGTTLTAMPEQLLRRRGGGDLEAGVRATAERYLLRRLGRPEEIAQAVVFLAGPRASFLTGAVVPVDGGVTAQ